MIRKIYKDDVDVVTQLGMNYDKNFINTYHILEYINNPIYEIYVYDEDGIKGFIIGTNLNKEKEIHLIYVDKMFRKQNIGFQLLSFFENEASTIILEVSIENFPALKLYQKAGYKEISRRKGYYNGVDAIVMKKEFK